MSAVETRKLTTSAADGGLPLSAFLSIRLRVPPGEAMRLVAAGAVFLDRKRAADPAVRLRAGQRVVVHVAGELAAPQFTVAYQDDEIVIADKPAGMPSQATRERTSGALDDAVHATWPHAVMLHRLDRAASGLVLFVVEPAAAARWQARLADHTLERRYRAVVRGRPAADQLLLDRPIGRDPADPRRRRAGQGQPARTHVEVLRRGADRSLVAVRLETGRTHQIRVHLADAGHPIWGDHLYDPTPPADAARLFLHACELRWPGAEPVTSPTPPELEALG